MSRTIREVKETLKIYFTTPESTAVDELLRDRCDKMVQELREEGHRVFYTAEIDRAEDMTVGARNHFISNVRISALIDAQWVYSVHPEWSATCMYELGYHGRTGRPCRMFKFKDWDNLSKEEALFLPPAEVL